MMPWIGLGNLIIWDMNIFIIFLSILSYKFPYLNLFITKCLIIYFIQHIYRFSWQWMNEDEGTNLRRFAETFLKLFTIANFTVYTHIRGRGCLFILYTHSWCLFHLLNVETIGKWIMVIIATFILPCLSKSWWVNNKKLLWLIHGIALLSYISLYWMHGLNFLLSCTFIILLIFYYHQGILIALCCYVPLEKKRVLLKTKYLTFLFILLDLFHLNF